MKKASGIKVKMQKPAKIKIKPGKGMKMPKAK
jgi:hypothetical protein